MPLLLKIGLFFLMFIIVGGRIYLGVHYMSDVLAGVCLGGGLTFGTAGFCYPYLQNPVSPNDGKVKWLLTWQKVLIGVLAVLVVLVSGLSAFALKFYHSSQKMADSMYSPVERGEKQRRLKLQNL